VTLHGRARGFFDKLPAETIVVPVYVRRVDRAVVTGKLGTLDSMQDAAENRLSWWKTNRVAGVPPKLDDAVGMGRKMKDGKAMAFDALLEPKQMGIFRYNTAELSGGRIAINARMKLFCALIGDQFCYATAVHELTHKLDRLAGKLTPTAWREGEVSAFRTQYDWLKIVDETGEKLVTKHSELRIQRDQETDPQMRELLADAVEYLEHLSEVVETNGKEPELYRLVDRLYRDKHLHGGPVESAKVAVPSPTRS
jgi:hypothetical protein